MPQNEHESEDFFLQMVETATDTETPSIKVVARFRGQEVEAPVDPERLGAFTSRAKARDDELGREEAIEMGQELMDIFFIRPIRDFYQLARGEAREVGLRTLISMEPGSSLQALPWELLHDGRIFLARQDSAPLARLYRLPEPIKPITVQPPLRVLVTTASPRGETFLDVDGEEETIRNLLADLDVEYSCLRDVSIAELERTYLRAKNGGSPFHIWHHCGHGKLDEDGRFELTLHREGTLDPEPVGIAKLGSLFESSPSLRLALINVCHGASLRGLATHLAELNVPATVGMATRIEDAAAHRFMDGFYAALLHTSVEEAVSQARRLMADEDHPMDWLKVVLFSRTQAQVPFLRSAPKPADSPGKSDPATLSREGKASKVEEYEEIEYPDGTLKRTAKNADGLNWYSTRRGAGHE